MKSRKIWLTAVFVAALFGGMATKAYSTNYEIYEFDIENRLGGAHDVTFVQDGSIFVVTLKDGPTTIDVNEATDKIYAIKKIWQGQFGNEPLIFNLTTTQRDSITPMKGMRIHNSTMDKIQIWENSTWISLAGLPITIADHADGTANHVLGWDGSGVAVSQSRDGTRVTHLSAIVISTGTQTILPFNSEVFDDNDLHDTVTNNSRLTAVDAGRYFISAAVSWAQVVTGTREIHIKLNGTTIIGLRKSKATEADLYVQGLSIIYNLAVDDYVEVQVYHSRGSNLNINSVGNYTPIFMMQRLRSQ